MLSATAPVRNLVREGTSGQVRNQLVMGPPADAREFPTRPEPGLGLGSG